MLCRGRLDFTWFTVGWIGPQPQALRHPGSDRLRGPRSAICSISATLQPGLPRGFCGRREEFKYESRCGGRHRAPAGGHPFMEFVFWISIPSSSHKTTPDWTVSISGVRPGDFAARMAALNLSPNHASPLGLAAFHTPPSSIPIGSFVPEVSCASTVYLRVVLWGELSRLS